jgi:Alkylmercury lyase
VWSGPDSRLDGRCAEDAEDMMAVAEQVRETETRGAFAAAREQLATACSVPQDRIEPFLREFLPSAVALDHRGVIIAFSGLSLVPTHHRFAVDGTMLFTCCAFDALFLPEILGKPATLITRCPGSGAELSVELAPGEVTLTPESSNFQRNITWL